MILQLLSNSTSRVKLNDLYLLLGNAACYQQLVPGITELDAGV